MFDGFGNLDRRARLRSLESHVLKKVGNAVLLGEFMPPADQDMHGNGSRAKSLHPVGRDPQPVGKGGYPGAQSDDLSMMAL